MSGRRRGRPVASYSGAVPQRDQLDALTDLVMDFTRNVQTMQNASSSTLLSNEGSPQPPMLSMPVPPFDPSNELASVHTYIHQLEELGRVHAWEQHTLICMATSHLEGLVRLWYLNQKVLQDSWAEWKVLLQKAFPQKVNFEQVVSKILKRTVAARVRTTPNRANLLRTGQ